VTDPATPPSSVAEYLRASRSAHASYRLQSRSRDYPALEDLLYTALTTRQAAHALDPDQADPAWESDQQINKGVSSVDLLAFYEKYLVTP
jgi:hypothetical protein